MREITDDLCEELLIQILDGLLEHFPKGFLGELVKPQNIIVGTQIDNLVRTSCASPGRKFWSSSRKNFWRNPRSNY